jgi:dTDP-4-amino-4,6-dideoxygalactose transaminase
MKVPFANLTSQYRNLKPEIDQAIDSVLDSGNFIGGEPIRLFEKNFADVCSVKHCIGLGNGTAGLFLALKALDVGPGDEVITPAWSWISTSEVITMAGAKPVFADVDPAYYTITASEIERKITGRTKAVIIVHLYGQVAEIKRIKEFCDSKNISIIEDCSQAHLSEENGVVAGAVGDCGVFSFYPTKNLGAYGDAGCVITNNESLAIKIRRLANHGGLSKDEHLMEGFNSRLDTIQAAILNVKLPLLSVWTKKRIELAQLYSSDLTGISGITLPEIRVDTIHSFHLFVVLAEKREQLEEYLSQREIQTLVHYPKALPFEPAYSYLNHKESDFPVSAHLQNVVLSLPLYPELSREQVVYVCKSIRSFYETF